MHDRQCTGGAECVSRDDHARRTQHGFARLAADAYPDARELARVIHDHACLAHRGIGADECANRDEHIETAAGAAENLHAALQCSDG